MDYFAGKKGLKTPLNGVENKVLKSPKLGCKISDMEKLKVSSLEVELMSFNVESKPVKKVQKVSSPENNFVGLAGQNYQSGSPSKDSCTVNTPMNSALIGSKDNISKLNNSSRLWFNPSKKWRKPNHKAN